MRAAVVVSSLLMVVGCRSGPDSDALATLDGIGQDRCGATGELVLSLKTSFPLPDGITPGSVMVTSEQDLLIRDRVTHELLLVHNSTVVDRRPSAGSFLAAMTDTVFVADGENELRLNRFRVRNRRFTEETDSVLWVPFRVSDLGALQGGAERFWVSVTDRGETRLHSLESTEHDGELLATLRQATPLPQPVHLTLLSDGRLLIADVEYPHSVLLYSAELDEIGRAERAKVRSFRRSSRGNRGGMFSLPPLVLDCNYVLQTLTDLTSNRRELTLLRFGSVDTVIRRMRTIEIEDPIGFFHADPTDRHLIGLRSLGGGWEVVEYVWSWN